EFGALPLGKGGQSRMRRAADKIDRAIAQRAIGLVDRKDELQRDVEPFLLEETKLDRGHGWKIGVRDQIRDSELHRKDYLSSAVNILDLLSAPAKGHIRVKRNADGASVMSDRHEHQGVDWKIHGVKVIPGDQLDPNTAQTPGMDRAAAINLARVGAQKIWAGTVKIHANAKTG